MMVEIPVESVIKIDLNSENAFVVLCKTLDMECVLDEDTEFIIKKNEDDENNVYVITSDGKESLYDERGDLFIALRNVAVNIFPNLYFRGDSYILN